MATFLVRVLVTPELKQDIRITSSLLSNLILPISYIYKNNEALSFSALKISKWWLDTLASILKKISSSSINSGIPTNNSVCVTYCIKTLIFLINSKWSLFSI